MTDRQPSDPSPAMSPAPSPASTTARSPDPSGPPSPAEVFERFFGPSLSAPWARVLLEHAEPRPDDRVLDLACATGIVARTVAAGVVDDSAVMGVDSDPEMLAVARRRAEAENLSIDWREGDAMQLDLPDAAFDLVCCQQGLQFFPDPVLALREMRRVLVDGGRVALNVWPALERHPVYSALLRAEADYLGAELDDVAMPFTFGGEERLRRVLTAAGFEAVDVATPTLELEFEGPDTFVRLTLLAGAAVVPEFAPRSPAQQQELVAAVARQAADVLRRYRVGDRLRFPMPNHVAIARA
jgi:SAM-dependent methyltransferase